MSNKGNMRHALKSMGIPLDEIDEEIETYRMVENLKKNKEARKLLREKVKEVNMQVSQAPQTVEEALAAQKSPPDPRAATEKVELEGPPEREVVVECSKTEDEGENSKKQENNMDNNKETNMDQNNNQETNMDQNDSPIPTVMQDIINQEACEEQVLTEKAKEQESRDEADGVASKEAAEKALQEFERLMALVQRAGDPTGEVLLSFSKRAFLPRDWKEGVAMGAGAVAGGAGAALLLDAATGGIVTGSVVGVAGVKVVANCVRKDEELSRDLRAIVYKGKVAGKNLNQKVRGFLGNLFRKNATQE